MDPSISAITPAQIPELLKFIRELAQFEMREQEVEATTASLRPAAGREKTEGERLADSAGQGLTNREDRTKREPRVADPGLGEDIIESAGRTCVRPGLR